MIKSLMELDEFNVSKLSNVKLNKFYDFLEDYNYVKFFVWLDQASEVQVSFDSAPKYFGKQFLLINPFKDLKDQRVEQYQVCYFIKRAGKEVITLQRIDQQIITGQINDNPLDDLLTKMTNEYVPKLRRDQPLFFLQDL